MAKAQASLGVTVAVFGFDPSPRRRPTGSPRPHSPAGASQGRAGRPGELRNGRGAGCGGGRDAAGSRPQGSGRPSPPGRYRRRPGWPRPSGDGLVLRHRPLRRGCPACRLEPARPGTEARCPDSAALKAALGHLRSESRHVAGAVGLLARSSPATTCSGSISLSTAARKGANAPSAAASRSCATAVCSAGPRLEVAALRLRVARFRSPGGHRRTAAGAPPLRRERRRGGAARRAEDAPLSLSATRRPSLRRPTSQPLRW